MKRFLLAVPFILAACDGGMTAPRRQATATANLPSFSVSPPVFTDFENFNFGTVDGQFDWTSTGAAGHGCAVYDHAIVANTYGYLAFGTKSLRMSNAVTSGCFGDQTLSGRTANPAGETGAADGGFGLGGTLQNHFEAQWSFASTDPHVLQPGLSVVASPDRGDGSRMSWVQMTDELGGLAINFFDVQGTSNPANFVESFVASGLDRTVPHTVRLTMDFFDGPSNDVVKLYVDGVLMHTGTSWENYYRYDSEQGPAGNLVPIVNRILFRTGGAPAPATAGKGFVIDNLQIGTFTVATDKDACKKGGWMNLSRPDGSSFKNQGDCIKFVNTGK
jgi:hypothetical protein